jgi:hypothetical protein
VDNCIYESGLYKKGIFWKCKFWSHELKIPFKVVEKEKKEK